MEPEELKELLEDTRSRDPISAIADAHNSGGGEGDSEGDGRGGERGDHMYLSALGKTKVEAEAELKDLQKWTNKRLLEGLDVSTTLLFDE